MFINRTGYNGLKKGSVTWRSPIFILSDLLTLTNTTWERKKAAGVDSSGLRPIWLPTVDNLRNFFNAPQKTTRFPELKESLVH